MTKSIAATETAIKRAIKANNATGKTNIIEITKTGKLLLVPAELAERGTALNENQFDNEEKIIL